MRRPISRKAREADGSDAHDVGRASSQARVRPPQDWRANSFDAASPEIRPGHHPVRPDAGRRLVCFGRDTARLRQLHPPLARPSPHFGRFFCARRRVRAASTLTRAGKGPQARSSRAVTSFNLAAGKTGGLARSQTAAGDHARTRGRTGDTRLQAIGRRRVAKSTRCGRAPETAGQELALRRTGL